MSKFKVGATVRVINNGKSYTTYTAFIEKYAKVYKEKWNKHWEPPYGVIGKVVAQGEHENYNDQICVIQSNDGVFMISENGIELVAYPKILITTDGTTTLARLYEGKKVIRTAEAKCAPSDTFDFTAGANIAYDRLMRPKVKTEPKPEAIKLYCVNEVDSVFVFRKGKIYRATSDYRVTDEYGRTTPCSYASLADYDKRNPSYAGALLHLVQRPAKVGEWVLLTNASCHRANKYKNGDVVRVKKDIGGGCFAFGDCDTYSSVTSIEYLVLDGYKGETK